MARARNGEAIRSERRTRPEMRRLRRLLAKAEKQGDLKTWRRAKAVEGYLRGDRVIAIAGQLGVTRGSVNRWLQWYDAQGAAGAQAAQGRRPHTSVDRGATQRVSHGHRSGAAERGLLHRHMDRPDDRRHDPSTLSGEVPQPLHPRAAAQAGFLVAAASQTAQPCRCGEAAILGSNKISRD